MKKDCVRSLVFLIYIEPDARRYMCSVLKASNICLNKLFNIIFLNSYCFVAVMCNICKKNS